MSSGDTVCLVALPYLVLCGYFYEYLSDEMERTVAGSVLCESDKDQLLWMISAMSMLMFWLSPILYYLGIQQQLIYWLIFKKLELKYFPTRLIKGG